MMRFISFICLVIISPLAAQARPVSYPGGFTLMQMNNMNNHSIHTHYSPTAKFSLGYKGEYWREYKWQFHGVQANRLLKRWNKPESQANLYLKAALGLVESRDNDQDMGGFAGIALDWENRRFFGAYENRFYEPGELDSFVMQRARLGVAPYLGDYGDLHTWIMLQVEHNNLNDEGVVLTPLVRFFKDEYLTEIGLSENGDALVNLVIRF